MMFGDLAQRDLDGASDIHPCAFRRRSYPSCPPAKTKSAGQFVGEKLDLSSQLLAAAQVVKCLRLGQFPPQLSQLLLVGCACLWIKDFARVAELLDVIRRQAEDPKGRSFRSFLAETRTSTGQSEDMELLVRMSQQMSNRPYAK